ncbi:hypothetical protein EGI20_00830 [Aquitalea sp. S1-19]|nr:hypothetical protein [Aquitalea sp. S1-19]
MFVVYHPRKPRRFILKRTKINHMQNLKTITVNAVTLPQVTYKGLPVVTAGAIAAIHHLRDASNVRTAFNLNRARFTEGRDYFKLSPAEAKELGFVHTSTKLEGVKLTQDFTFFRYASAGMVLFTKAGYLMLTKTFRDDTAWAIQRQLVDYFTLEASTKHSDVRSRVYQSPALAGIALQDTPSLPDGDHLRTAMALPVNRMATLQEATTGAYQKADALLHSLTLVNYAHLQIKG